MESFVRNQVLLPFTFPEGITINVAKVFGLDLKDEAFLRRPEGVLLLKVIRAENVPKTDLFGLSDPYCKYVSVITIAVCCL